MWAPPPRLSVSEWADHERRLSPEASAEPGQWRTDRAEYQRGILDAIGDPKIGAVVVMSSAQVGKTEILLNAIGYYMALDSSPMLLLQPTLEMAEAFSKDRLAPMLRDTPALNGLVKDPKSRDASNTLLHKVFTTGGAITLAGANSPSSLASRPIRIVYADEVDRYPPSAGTEGDPVTLARARTKNFWNRKLAMTSTPTIKGLSRIEQAYEESDKRRYWVPCAHCGEKQVLRWAQVRWESNLPDTARYFCEHCGTAWEEGERLAAIRHGEWRGEAPFRGIAGFHLNELYSPWSSPAEIARQFLDAKHSRSIERMRAWTNTCLGECYEDDGERIDETGIADRAEQWTAEPVGVLVRTLGVDVQEDRLEFELVGWGADFESWSLRYDVIWGDTTRPEVWTQLDDLMIDLAPAAVCIDSGFNTDAVLRFCKPRLRRRIYAIKGMAGAGRPIWPKRGSRNNKARTPHFMVGVDAAKYTIYGWLKATTPGPGFCHFPQGRDEHYYAGLASETMVTRYSKGFPVREWKKRAGARNEPLDCRVYAYAALCSFTINWQRLAEQKKSRPAETPAPPPQQQQAPQPWARDQRFAPPGKVGFVNRWKY